MELCICTAQWNSHGEMEHAPYQQWQHAFSFAAKSVVRRGKLSFAETQGSIILLM
jgi:hypothetical protein